MRNTFALAGLLGVALVAPGLARPSLSDSAAVVLRETPPAHVDTESPESRELRLSPVARAMGAVARNPEELAALLAIGWHESRWAEYVGGDCQTIPKGASGDCDEGRSRSYWQVRKWCTAAWAFPAGDPRAIPRFAECAVRQYRTALRNCKGRHPAGDIAGAFSGYRSIRCDWPGAVARVETYQKTLLRLYRLE